MSELSDWLDARGLGALHEVLASQQIDVDILPDLTEGDLKDLGIALGPRRRLLKAIQAATTPAAPARPAADPAEAAERRQLSVLFVDLVGSTALSARRDPEEMRQIVRRYQNTVAGEIARFDGYVAKFMGDGVLAYFGWPKAHEDEAERAVRAGLAAVQAVGELTTGDGQHLSARAAIATGVVVVGDLVGEGAAQEAAVIGDTPNIAFRLQELAAPGRVVIADSTQLLVGAVFALDPLGLRQLKGFDAPLAAWAVERELTVGSRFAVRTGSRLRPMVGRDHELGLLCEHWQRASRSEGQCVLLVGEAGIGKSRITRALIDYVAGPAHTVLRFQCSPYHRDSAFWPIMQQASFAARLAPDDSTAARLDKIEAMLHLGAERIDEAAPLVASLLGVPGEERYGALDLAPQIQRARTLDVLVEQVHGLARHKPVLMVFEDVHWIDPSTLELIHLTLDRIGRRRVLLLLTSRPDGQPSLGAHPDVTRLVLNRLTRDAVEAITAGIDGSAMLSDTMRHEIAARTDGVPLFVEELTRALVDLAGQSHLAGADRAALEARLNVPATLHDSLMARLDRLPEVKRVAQIAACIGRNFDYPTLAAIAGMAGAELQQALDRLADAELIFRRGTPPEASYTFKHALVRDAAANSLLRSEYRRINASIVAAFEAAVPPPPPELIARHAELAALDQTAIEHLRRAAHDATARYANQEAISHLERALRLLSGLPASAERTRLEVEILVAIGVPQIAVHGFAAREVEATYRRAVELSEGIDDAALHFQAIRGLWNCIYDRADLEDAYGLADRLCAIAADHLGPVERALGFRAIGGTRFNQGRFREALQAFEQAIEAGGGIAQGAGIREHGESPWVISRIYAGWTATLLGDLDRGLALGEEALEAARAIDHPMTLAFAGHLSALIRYDRNEPVACAPYTEESARISEFHRLIFWQAGGELMGGWSAARLTGDRTGVERVRRGVRAWQASGAELHLPTWYGVLADAMLAVGSIDEAGETIDHGLALAEGRNEMFAAATLWRLKGRVTARLGDAALATQYLEKAMAVARDQGALLLELRAASDLAHHLVQSGQGSRALDLLAPVAARFAPDVAAGCLEEARRLVQALK